ncbi:hypothetical protein H8B09_11230 [Paenibacillus sp. PR3]|uniref:Uncharacterized protein n=1 Tax=Paenibacillus terricola TaxID=2763503 RepID=A0ABR8MTP2_9BACL|nr:hypothetical protein [Paenibacillus terricola]MBD3919328.1 hypothetical protein [Paenibacillus terricola]
MSPNLWLALIIFIVINGIIIWQMVVEMEPMSRRVRKWFFIVGNAIALCLSVAEFIWMEF